MKILVTGGTGYIGSHTCINLLELGYKVLVLDNLSNSKRNALNNISKIVNIRLNTDEGKDDVFSFVQTDIRDKESLEKVFARQKIDVVIHFAGLKSVNESIEKPAEYYDNNVIGSINLFEVMKKFNCKTIVFSSSATVYGDCNVMPIKENFPLLPTNPYGKFKIAVEELLQNIFKSDPTWRVGILRYFNPIGAHKSGLIGENLIGIPNNLMPYIMQVAAGRLKKLNVFGGDYDTHDGTGVRDYIHVMDLALGHSKLLDVLMKKPQILTMNLGTGIGYSVLDIVNTFKKVSNMDIAYKIVNRRPGDVAICYADPGYSKLKLEWEAQYTLEDMCKDSWNYMLKN